MRQIPRCVSLIFVNLRNNSHSQFSETEVVVAITRLLSITIPLYTLSTFESMTMGGVECIMPAQILLKE